MEANANPSPNKTGAKEVILQIPQEQATASEKLRSSSSSSADKPPKIPPISTPSFTYSKSKSRLVEPSHPDETKLKIPKPSSEGSAKGSPTDAPGTFTPKSKENPRSIPGTPKTPLVGATASDDEEEDEDEDVYKTAVTEAGKHAPRKWKAFLLTELAVFFCLMVLLITSLLVDKLQRWKIWGLQFWKWLVLVVVIVSGRLVSELLIKSLVFLIERNFLLKKKVLYFVYGVRKSVQAFLWLGFILLAWGLLISNGVKRSRQTTKVLHYVTRTLAGLLVGAVVWLLKTFLVKLVASKFHVRRFFDRIQESIFHQYVLRMLSGPPVLENEEKIGGSKNPSGRLSFVKRNDKRKEEVIDVDKLTKMKPKKVSAWTMTRLVDVISTTRLSTLSGALDQTDDEDGVEEREIISEYEAKATAYRIFQNVAYPGNKYIKEEDLLRFMKKEEVDAVIPLFEGAAVTKKIKRSALKKWVVNVYNERKSLSHSLNDAKTAIEELNRLLSAIVVIVSAILWCLIMGFLTTQVLVFISSQLLLVAFMFGNTAKTVFEAIIFVFVMHPFDIGDRCVIDGVQMVVEEMNILNTVFLRYDNEKIYYPNSTLATKPISNFYRSPEMSDTVEFCVDVRTSVETIGAIKTRIKGYLESKPEHWKPNHSMQVKEIENVNKMKIALYVNHTISFQNIADRGNRRSDLLLEMKKIFEELGVEYSLLPQEVRVSYVAPLPSSGFPLRS